MIRRARWRSQSICSSEFFSVGTSPATDSPMRLCRRRMQSGLRRCANPLQCIRLFRWQVRQLCGEFRDGARDRSMEHRKVNRPEFRRRRRGSTTRNGWSHPPVRVILLNGRLHADGVRRGGAGAVLSPWTGRWPRVSCWRCTRAAKRGLRSLTYEMRETKAVAGDQLSPRQHHSNPADVHARGSLT